MIEKINRLLDELGISVENRINIIDYLKERPERVRRIFYYRILGYTWEEVAEKENIGLSTIYEYWQRNTKKNDSW